MKRDIPTYIMKWKRRIIVTYSVITKGFSWKTLLLCDIGLHRIPKSTIFMHPYAICISDSVQLGENCDIRQCVTIGNRHPKQKQGVTKVGDRVFFGAGCTVLGYITIGNNVIIGAGAIVLADVPDNMTIVGIWKGAKNGL